MIKFIKNIFRGKTELEKLEAQHKDLLGQAFIASKSNRTLSDTLTFEASKIEEKIIELRKNEKLPMLGIAASNIRRQILRLRDIFIVEKVKNNYRIAEFSPLTETFENKVENFFLPNILERVKLYLKEIDSKF